MSEFAFYNLLKLLLLKVESLFVVYVVCGWPFWPSSTASTLHSTTECLWILNKWEQR